MLSKKLNMALSTKEESKLNDAFKVELRRDKLEKQRRLNMGRVKWVDCVLFVYPSKQTLLLKGTGEHIAESPKWKCFYQDNKESARPTMAFESFKSKKLVVTLNGLQVSYMTSAFAEEKEVTISFRKRADLEKFKKAVSTFISPVPATPNLTRQASTSSVRNRGGISSHALARSVQSRQRRLPKMLLNLITKEQDNAGSITRKDAQILSLITGALDENNDDDDEEEMALQREYMVFCDTCQESYSSTDLKEANKLENEYKCPEGHLLFLKN